MWKLTIIGKGRLGRSLHSILSIPHSFIGKNEEIPTSDIYYLAVPDRKISEFAHTFPKGSTVVHASGVLPHTVLRPHDSVSVLHPLMTFPGPDLGMPTSPIFASITGDDSALEKTKWLANQLGFQTFHYDGNRARYHCAAVMAGNFGSLLLDMAAQVMSSESNISREEARKKLLPLVLESLENCASSGMKAITGPIVRKDKQTISLHRTELSSISNRYLQTYDLLSEGLHQQIQTKD